MDDYMQDPSYAGSGAGGPKRCNCKKARCLKLYCVCFAAGVYCSNCPCRECLNTLETQQIVLMERNKKLQQSPGAFAPKVGQKAEGELAHKKGCRCRRSKCMKKYCECFDGQVFCSAACRCESCENQPQGGGHPPPMNPQLVHTDMHSSYMGGAVPSRASTLLAALAAAAAAGAMADMGHATDAPGMAPHHLGHLANGASLLEASVDTTRAPLVQPSVASTGAQPLLMPYMLAKLGLPGSALPSTQEDASGMSVMQMGGPGTYGMGDMPPASFSLPQPQSLQQVQEPNSMLQQDGLQLDIKPLDPGRLPTAFLPPNGAAAAAAATAAVDVGTAASSAAAAVPGCPSEALPDSSTGAPPILLQPAGGAGPSTTDTCVAAGHSGSGGGSTDVMEQDRPSAAPHCATLASASAAQGEAVPGPSLRERGRRSSSGPEDPPDGPPRGSSRPPRPPPDLVPAPPVAPPPPMPAQPLSQPHDCGTLQDVAEAAAAAAAAAAGLASLMGAGSSADGDRGAYGHSDGGSGSDGGNQSGRLGPPDPTILPPPLPLVLPDTGPCSNAGHVLVESLAAAPALLLEDPDRAAQLAAGLGMDAAQQMAACKAAGILRTLLQMAAVVGGGKQSGSGWPHQQQPAGTPFACYGGDGSSQQQLACLPTPLQPDTCPLQTQEQSDTLGEQPSWPPPAPPYPLQARPMPPYPPCPSYVGLPAASPAFTVAAADTDGGRRVSNGVTAQRAASGGAIRLGTGSFRFGAAGRVEPEPSSGVSVGVPASQLTTGSGAHGGAVAGWRGGLAAGLAARSPRSGRVAGEQDCWMGGTGHITSTYQRGHRGQAGDGYQPGGPRRGSRLKRPNTFLADMEVGDEAAPVPHEAMHAGTSTHMEYSNPSHPRPSSSRRAEGGDDDWFTGTSPSPKRSRLHAGSGRHAWGAGQRSGAAQQQCAWEGGAPVASGGPASAAVAPWPATDARGLVRKRSGSWCSDALRAEGSDGAGEEQGFAAGPGIAAFGGSQRGGASPGWAITLVGTTRTLASPFRGATDPLQRGAAAAALPELRCAGTAGMPCPQEGNGPDARGFQRQHQGVGWDGGAPNGGATEGRQAASLGGVGGTRQGTEGGAREEGEGANEIEAMQALFDLRTAHEAGPVAAVC